MKSEGRFQSYVGAGRASEELMSGLQSRTLGSGSIYQRGYVSLKLEPYSVELKQVRIQTVDTLIDGLIKTQRESLQRS